MIWTAMILLAAQTAGVPQSPQQSLTVQQKQALSQYNFQGATAAFQSQNSKTVKGQNALTPIPPLQVPPIVTRTPAAPASSSSMGGTRRKRSSFWVEGSPRRFGCHRRKCGGGFAATR